MRWLCCAAAIGASVIPALADAPPPPAFDADLVAPGKTWWCATAGDRFCTRARADCGGSMVSCKATATAFAYTIAADEMTRTIAPASAFATATACETARKAAPGNASACKPIASTTLRAVSAGDIPGTGWFCYTNHGAADSGACARTVEQCARLRAQTVSSALGDSAEPGDCVAADSAWATRVGHAVIARATMPACEAIRARQNARALATACGSLR